MEDKDYKVIAVAPGEAKPYTNNYGTTYYRDVRLADAQGREHPKPVSLGKKSADAFQVGMELYGHILVEQSFPTDKFKAASKQQAGFAATPPPQPSNVAYNPKPAYKDNSDGQRQGMCFNNAANYVNSRKDSDNYTAEQWAEWVHKYANALYKLGDLGGETSSPKVSKPWQVNTKDPKAKFWPSENEGISDDEAASLYQSIAQGETVPDDDIPPEFR
jgi:hypothetical protein